MTLITINPVHTVSPLYKIKRKLIHKKCYYK